MNGPLREGPIVIESGVIRKAVAAGGSNEYTHPRARVPPLGVGHCFKVMTPGVGLTSDVHLLFVLCGGGWVCSCESVLCCNSRPRGLQTGSCVAYCLTTRGRAPDLRPPLSSLGFLLRSTITFFFAVSITDNDRQTKRTLGRK